MRREGSIRLLSPKLKDFWKFYLEQQGGIVGTVEDVAAVIPEWENSQHVTEGDDSDKGDEGEQGDEIEEKKPKKAAKGAASKVEVKSFARKRTSFVEQEETSKKPRYVVLYFFNWL
jgi:hypothetical protein